jgi:Holliday junction resolvase RusA-like endonuclease
MFNASKVGFAIDNRTVSATVDNMAVQRAAYGPRMGTGGALAKRRVKLDVRLPRYPTEKGATAGKPGMAWRRSVHSAIEAAAARRGIKRYEGVDLECDVVLYLTNPQLAIQDVDNLLKHIFDALQGRLGGPKGGTRPPAILPNDYQIRRVCVEKFEAISRKQTSRLIIRDYAKR